METATARVTIYSLPGCLQCHRLKAFLVQRAVCFTEINVLTQPKAIARIALGYQAVLPLVLLDGEVLRAPSARKMAAALGLPPPRRATPAGRRPPPGVRAGAATPVLA
jgi:glutaredoxin